MAVSMPTRTMPNSIHVNNRPLTPEELHAISINQKPSTINYSGDFNSLEMILHQLSEFKTQTIDINLGDINVDNRVCLDFSQTGSNVKLYFNDYPEDQSNFYNYLINIWEPVLQYAKNNLSPDIYNRIVEERQIQKEFLIELKKSMLNRNKTIDDYSKTQLMDVVFNYVCKNFPYDFSIVDKNGGHTAESTTLGGFANTTYKRGKGVCAGRSKLIKLLTNNRELEVPCYLCDGNIGSQNNHLAHCWNEYINEQGEVIVYDSSYNRKCNINNLPDCYFNIKHEPEVKKALARRI